jgi:hypothetical protein
MVCFLALAARFALCVPVASCLMACTTIVSFSAPATPDPDAVRRTNEATIITYTAVRGASRRFPDYSRINTNILKKP